jgi:class 3 adenylate cyclase/CHASE2 domain-containing sensor protein
MKVKQIRQVITSLCVVVAATALASLSTSYITFLAALENAAGDIRIAALQPPQAQSPHIVIAAITEETVARFPYRSPVDRGFIAELLLTLEKKGARVIALDVLFDQPTEAAKDDALKRTLRALKVPTLVSYTDTPSVVNEEQLAYLQDFVPENLRAAANIATDPYDGTARWIFPGERKAGEPKGFARKAAELAGVNTPAAQVPIAWKPQPDSETQPFAIFPAHLAATLPDAWFAGKVVLVGGVLSIVDRHRTPLANVHDDDRGNMPGVIIQAHATAQYLEGRQALVPGLASVLGTACALALLGVLIGLLKKGIAFNVIAGLGVIGVFWTGGMLGFSYGLPLLPLVGPTLALALSLWMMDVLLGSAERKQRKFVQGAFSRYVSPAVVNQLVENPDSLRISGERRELSFIFTDIQGFTTLSEKLSSEKLSDVLNAYLDGACAIIQRHEGMVDKFIGDAIMTIFNAPVLQADHAERAVRCALELDAYCEDFRERQNAADIPLGQTRLGVHTGSAVIGNFGSRTRMDFTALGDTVNTAARTEGVNKYFGTRICCTDSVVKHCTDLNFRPIGEVVLKGKLTHVELFNPVTAEEYASPLYHRYLEAYALMKNADPRAPEAVRQLHQDQPHDSLTSFHYERVEAGLNTVRIIMEDK